MTRKPPVRRHSRGVTLIELMIVVAIVAILARVAMPAYSNYVQRGKVGEAVSNLTQMRIQLEQYYQDHAQDSVATTKGYGTGGSGCGGSTSTTTGGTTTVTPNSTAVPDATTANLNCASASQNFKYTCGTYADGSNNATTDTYLLTATGCGGMSGYVYTLDYRGNKQTLKYNGTTYAAGVKTCWLMRGGEC